MQRLALEGYEAVIEKPSKRAGGVGNIMEGFRGRVALLGKMADKQGTAIRKWPFLSVLSKGRAMTVPTFRPWAMKQRLVSA